MRDNSVSIAKGIAIILMVLAHSRFSQYGNEFINMFHMPLFFFFSGYCFKERYLDDVKTYLKKKITGIWLPYVKWSILFLLCHNIFFHLNIYSSLSTETYNHLYSFQEIATKGIHILTKMGDHEQLLGGYWFMKCLFWASLIGFAVIKYCRKTMMGGVILIILTVILYMTNIRIPYFDIGARDILASSFFMCGYCYRKINVTEWVIRWCAFLSLPLTIAGVEYWQGSLLDMDAARVLPYMLCALVDTLAVHFFCKLIIVKCQNISKILTYVGENTLTILTWHFLCFKVVSIVIITIYNLPLEHLSMFPVIEGNMYNRWWMVYTLTGCVIPLAVISIFNTIKKI